MGFHYRPIVPSVSSCTYDIAILVAKELKPYSTSLSSYVKNSVDFVSKLRDVTVGEDEVFVSFDVKSLFTNVPVEEAMQIVDRLLNDDENQPENEPSLSPASISALLRISLKVTYFRFRSGYYELSDGLAMGSPVSPAVANIFMGAGRDSVTFV